MERLFFFQLVLSLKGDLRQLVTQSMKYSQIASLSASSGHVVLLNFSVRDVLLTGTATKWHLWKSHPKQSLGEQLLRGTVILALGKLWMISKIYLRPRYQVGFYLLFYLP